MKRANFLQDLLATIFQRQTQRIIGDDDRSFAELCNSLLSENSEAAGLRIAAAILDRFESAPRNEKKEFFQILLAEHDIDCSAVIEAAERYSQRREVGPLTELLARAEPRRQELLRRLNQLNGGTGRLVKMREELLELIADDPSLHRLDLDFKHLFVSWFNRGFLVLRQIDWTTPANILEKIVAYEAVHAINDWDDLRRRLRPSDRRCFAFFHPVMAEEPLIFVEVALTTQIPSSIQELLADREKPIRDSEATTAVFYSISNCQRGLTGISFGNSLIKQVASDLSNSLPNLKTFVTLSPVPGLTHWLRSRRTDHAIDDEARQFRSHNLTASSADELRQFSNELMRLAAEYLMRAKRADGRPLDPVARFHLGNGASLERIHPLADCSLKGISEACGVMVSYRYDLATVDANHQAYAHQRKVIASRAVSTLIQPTRRHLHMKRTESV